MASTLRVKDRTEAISTGPKRIIALIFAELGPTVFLHQEFRPSLSRLLETDPVIFFEYENEPEKNGLRIRLTLELGGAARR